AEESTDPLPGGFDGSLCGFTQQGLKLGEDLLDRIEVRAVGRQKEQLGADRADGTAHGFPFVAAEIVDDHDISGLEGGHEHLLDIGKEALAIDRAVDDARRIDPVGAQCGEEGERAPTAVRDLGDQPLAASAASMRARHVGLGPSLVDEDETGGIKPPLVLLPLRSSPGDLGALLLAGVQAFFLELIPSCSQKCQTAKQLTLIPRSASSAASARSVMSGFSE